MYVANFSFTLTLKCDLPIHHAVDLHDDYNHISKDYILSMFIVNSNLEKKFNTWRIRLPVYEIMKEFVAAYTYTLGESECHFWPSEPMLSYLHHQGQREPLSCALENSWN